MIVLIHDNKKILKVISKENDTELTGYSSKSIMEGFLKIANDFPDEIVVWCHAFYQHNLNLECIPTLFHHKRIMISFNPNENFGKRVGYIEQSPFIKINKEVTYTTWQMSSYVGAIHTSVVNAVKTEFKPDSDFAFYLNSVSYSCMPFGLFCFSEPKLLKNPPLFNQDKTSIYSSFKFVKQHLKLAWIFILFLDILVFEKKFPLISLLKATFFVRRNKHAIDLSSVAVNSNLKVVDSNAIDVIIPTIGRKMPLYDVLCDLRNQTILPKKVIIVEQNALRNSTTELDYLKNEQWPFPIKHIFTHQLGVCNARNVALNETESEWVFLCDDDGRFESDLIEGTFNVIKKYGIKVVVNAYTTKNQIIYNHNIHQTSMFGSGCSIVKRESLNGVKFSNLYEFGYGEDKDFGQQLREKGFDVVFISKPLMLHLKAPVGGFRTKFQHPWNAEKIQPKPSPTVALYALKHYSEEQIHGYKLFLLIKSFQFSKNYNCIKYYSNFKKQWSASMQWADFLLQTRND